MFSTQGNICLVAESTGLQLQREKMTKKKKKLNSYSKLTQMSFCRSLWWDFHLKLYFGTGKFSGSAKGVGDTPLAIGTPIPELLDREGTEGRFFISQRMLLQETHHTHIRQQSYRVTRPVWICQPRPQLDQTNKLTKFISKFMFKPSPAPDD